MFCQHGVQTSPPDNIEDVKEERSDAEMSVERTESPTHGGTLETLEQKVEAMQRSINRSNADVKKYIRKFGLRMIVLQLMILFILACEF